MVQTLSRNISKWPVTTIKSFLITLFSLYSQTITFYLHMYLYLRSSRPSKKKNTKRSFNYHTYRQHLRRFCCDSGTLRVVLPVPVPRYRTLYFRRTGVDFSFFSVFLKFANPAQSRDVWVVPGCDCDCLSDDRHRHPCVPSPKGFQDRNRVLSMVLTCFVPILGLFAVWFSGRRYEIHQCYNW